MKSSFFFLRSPYHLRKSLHNLRVTLLCGLLTFIVLRSSLGAGKFGTPAKDYDEIRHRLHSFRLRHPQKLLVTREQLAAAIATSRKDALRRITLSLPVVSSVEEAPSYGEEVPHRGLYTSTSSSPRIMLITGSQLANCENALEAQFLHKLLKNKMDYCSLHGIEIFFYMEKDTDSKVQNLRRLRKHLVSYPQVQWLWWMDSTAMFTNMSSTLAYEMYARYNVVVFNSGDMMKGMRRSLLVRNCDWTRDNLAKLEQRNQWLSLPEVLVDMSLKMEVFGLSVGVDNAWPFITDFESCNVCSKDIDPSCLTDVEKAFSFADSQHRHLASM